MTNRVRITNNVSWETAHSQEAKSAFPEGGLDRLSISGLDKAIKSADIEALRSRLSNPTGQDGSEGRVFTVKDDDGLLVKVFHNRPFSSTGINAALEDGLSGHPLYGTPNYLGAITTPSGVNATIMTRAPGIEIGKIKPAKNLNNDPLLPYDEDENKLLNRLASTGRNALASVGVDPNLARWDFNDHNLFVPHAVKDWRELHSTPITIIDQMSNRLGDIDEWEGVAQPEPIKQDPRDVSAEEAADKAWKHLEPQLTGAKA